MVFAFSFFSRIFFWGLVLDPIPPLEWTSFPPLVTAVLIKGGYRNNRCATLIFSIRDRLGQTFLSLAGPAVHRDIEKSIGLPAAGNQNISQWGQFWIQSVSLCNEAKTPLRLLTWSGLATQDFRDRCSCSWGRVRRSHQTMPAQSFISTCQAKAAEELEVELEEAEKFDDSADVQEAHWWFAVQAGHRCGLDLGVYWRGRQWSQHKMKTVKCGTASRRTLMICSKCCLSSRARTTGCAMSWLILTRTSCYCKACSQARAKNRG